jgi:hypothetical protein
MGYANNNQGYFKPRHPEKYVGDVNKIRFMSSWELQADKFPSTTIQMSFAGPLKKLSYRM